MHHVFVSYKHEDGDFAEVLINRIEQAGFKTWIDSDRLHAGEDWRAEIDQAIKDSFALVVVMTPEARASEYVTYEWAFAWGVGVKVIPVLYKDLKLHPRLEALQHLDFFSHNRALRPWDALIKAIKVAENSYTPYVTAITQNIPPYIQKPIEALDSYDADERHGAIEDLANLNHPIAHQALRKAVQHTLQDVRINASFKVAHFKDASVLPVLLGILQRDDHSYLMLRAVDALRQFGNSATPHLREFLHTEDTKLREGAIDAIYYVGDASIIPDLLRILQDKDDKLRFKVVRALGRIGDDTTVPSLINALDDNYEEIRNSAAQALGRIGHASAITGLIKVLYDAESSVRSSASEALGKIGDSSAIPNLLEALYENEDTIQKLEAIILRKRVSVSEREREFMIRGIQDSIIESLVQIGNEAVPYLIKSLQKEYPQLRKKLIEALGKIGNAVAVPTLLTIAYDTENKLRYEAAIALGQIGDSAALSGLLQFKQEDLIMQRTVIRFLGKIEEDIAIPIILEALQQYDDEEVRRNAIKALNNVRGIGAITSLINFLSHSDKEVQRIVANALVNIGNAAVPDLQQSLENEKYNDRMKNTISSILMRIRMPEALDVKREL